MKSKIPVKKLVRFYVGLLSVFAFFNLFSSLYYQGWEQILNILRSVGIGFGVLLTNALINVVLLVQLYKYEKNTTPSKTGSLFLVLSYTLSLSMYLILMFIGTIIKHQAIDLKTISYIVMVCFTINSLLILVLHYIVLQEEKVQSDLEKSQLRTTNAEAANQLLRQQIHPHFLFNALNILKSLYKVNPKEGEKYLICLSDFLRASVSNNNIKICPLKEEIKLCTDYLEMQRIRFGDALTCSFSIDKATLENGFVPSFSIQPLIENAIKHNELTEESPLHILIEQQGDRIKVTNNLQLKVSSETSTGSGLANLSERYRILADDQVMIEENSVTFSVSLKILSHEDTNN